MTQSRADALVIKLEKGRKKTLEMLNGLEPEQWQKMIYTQPHWQIHHLLAHFVSAEKQLLMLAQDIVGGGPGAPANMNIDSYNADEQKRLKGQSTQELLEELDQARQQTIEWVSTLGSAELDQVGYHPVLGEVNVETLIAAMHGHHLMHIRDLSRLQKSDAFRNSL